MHENLYGLEKNSLILYIYLLQSCYNNNVQFYIKTLLKTHFFVVQIFRNHYGSFFLHRRSYRNGCEIFAQQKNVFLIMFI